MFGFWTGLVGSVCLIIGVMLGTLLPRGEKRVVREAPAPVELGYDPELRINGGQEPRRGETVEICGVPMTRM